jgi:hypothetical protein
MGMFDEVMVEQSLLPEPFNKGPEIKFQTKWLENQLHVYTITRDGLFKKDFHTNEVIKLFDFTGEFCFYGHYGEGNKGSVEFVARYKGGHLTHLHKRFQTHDLMEHYRRILAGAESNKN